ncbi:hypothetical protein POM88_042424 [Heracleum sosnowskyi]|uniref:Uncharacterized protein n=1 Tax=Heracleum sosnowskyi TaxID=360622 RepID=A0AAD8HHQ4_9APIA|nr:hypothetical protein POM88_042424 [Heracleum sosnowskyi]
MHLRCMIKCLNYRIVKRCNITSNQDGLWLRIWAIQESLSLSSQAWRSCGGAPNRECKQDNASRRKKHTKGSNETGKNRCKIKDLSIPIEGDFNLQIDIFDKFKQFYTPVADQMGHRICGPLSMCDNIGMMFGIQTRTYNPRPASQEITDWI